MKEAISSQNMTYPIDFSIVHKNLKTETTTENYERAVHPILWNKVEATEMRALWMEPCRDQDIRKCCIIWKINGWKK